MTDKALINPAPILAAQLQLPQQGVTAVLNLLAEGGTVPFIARYRKEATGALDEVQIRAIEERHGYLKELEQRRQTVLGEIEAQGKLDDSLRSRILACTTKTALEDIYLPFKPKRRTRAFMARERGLLPLGQRILEQPAVGDPEAEALAFVDPQKEGPDGAAALAGARDIAAEATAEHAAVRGMVRQYLMAEAELTSTVKRGKAKERTKFEQYYDFREKVSTIPSHRYLALRRGEQDKVLRLSLAADSDRILLRVKQRMGLDQRSPFASHLEEAVVDAWQRLLAPSVESDIRAELKERSDREAVDVFASNLRNLLLAAPLGARPVVGIDPGIRTGCKCVAVDETGKYLDTCTIYVVEQGPAREQQARRDLLAFLQKHRPFAVAVGNGTGGRETESFVRGLLSREGLGQMVTVQVSESGASVYSASDIAREEFPRLDLTIRGAISIARRLQDPLAELVKIEPKAIGVGQYQHDVHQPLIKRKLEEVVESCVNQVGVEVKTASAPLLAQVAGIGPSLAKKIVAHREQQGAFGSRQDLLKVSGLGPRAYEQAAGFLRIRDGSHPLDASAVHPERYALVEQMARDLRVDLPALVGSPAQVDRIDISKYIDNTVGEPTLRDILDELRKPGRDPRATFEPPRFREDVTTIGDLHQGMVLEGVVSNVTHFGAFVDLGVHQDGLVHISKLADHFVKDPRDVVKVGDRLKVRVLDVDLQRKRISLSARSEERPAPGPRRDPGQRKESGRRSNGPRPPRQQHQPRPDKGSRQFGNNPFTELLKKK